MNLSHYDGPCRFRGSNAAAPLKHDLGRYVTLSLSDFRGLPAAAPLELVLVERMSLAPMFLNSPVCAL